MRNFHRRRDMLPALIPPPPLPPLSPYDGRRDWVRSLNESTIRSLQARNADICEYNYVLFQRVQKLEQENKVLQERLALLMMTPSSNDSVGFIS